MTSRLEAAISELAAAIEALVQTPAGSSESPSQLLSIRDAAKRLGISRTALYGEFSRGRLRSVKVGRRRLIPLSSVAAYIHDATLDSSQGAR